MNEHTVCLLNDSFPPVIDGVANAVVNYAEHIESFGGRALVATPAVPGADDSKFTFPVLRYPSVDTRKRVGYVTGYPFSPKIAARLQKEQVALLHTHCPISSCLLARSLRDVTDAPLVLTYHTKFDIDIAKALRGKLLQEGAIHALIQNVRACDEVWVVSRGAGENLRSLGYDGDYIVMRNGTDIPYGRMDYNTACEMIGDYDLPTDIPLFLFVGRIMWYKGIRIILDALKMLQEAGKDFRMVFIGDGADSEDVRTYAQELALEKQCFFTGAITNRETIRAWYSRANLFLFPSTFDTNGLVVREAAACSTAAVMIDGSCAAEGITNGRNGFLVEENAASLAACLTKLYMVPDFVSRVGETASRELYMSWKTAVLNAYKRYEIIIDRYRSGYYQKAKRSHDIFFKSQGELMGVLAAVEQERQELQTNFNAARAELAGYQHEIRKGISAARETLWQKIDRYL